MNIVAALIIYGLLGYELFSGYAITRSITRPRKVWRNTEPLKYWSYLAFQFTFATAFLLYGLGIFG